MEQGPDELERDEDVSEDEKAADLDRLTDKPLDPADGSKMKGAPSDQAR